MHLAKWALSAGGSRFDSKRRAGWTEQTEVGRKGSVVVKSVMSRKEETRVQILTQKQISSQFNSVVVRINGRREPGTLFRTFGIKNRINTQVKKNKQLSHWQLLPTCSPHYTRSWEACQTGSLWVQVHFKPADMRISSPAGFMSLAFTLYTTCPEAKQPNSLSLVALTQKLGPTMFNVMYSLESAAKIGT